MMERETSNVALNKFKAWSWEGNPPRRVTLLEGSKDNLGYFTFVELSLGFISANTPMHTYAW